MQAGPPSCSQVDSTNTRSATRPRLCTQLPARERSAPAPIAHASESCAPRCRKSSRTVECSSPWHKLQQIRQRKPAPWRTQNRQPRGAVGKIRQRPPQRIQIANQRPIREPVRLYCAIIEFPPRATPPPALEDEFASAPAPQWWRASRRWRWGVRVRAGCTRPDAAPHLHGLPRQNP